MSRDRVSVALRRLVFNRAQGRCEYCLLHQDDTPFTHPIDHITAIRHGGPSSETNTALACLDCNRNKGADLSALDPLTGAITPLFHPRQQTWSDHFQLEGAKVIGLTAVGRATVALLRINDPIRLFEREMVIAVGRYPH